ncbi:hypothetical protein DFQ26_002351 [Actinomortierella ambigua]|nr:hypothetical protein DFQ26_002351 [Actinomortierella ambigua]
MDALQPIGQAAQAVLGHPFGHQHPVGHETIPLVICTYFVAWAIYARSHKPLDLPADKLTHILYAFANLNSDGRVVLGDPWADIDKHDEGVPWTDKKELHGNLRQLGLLKKRHRNLKVSLSIGGWTWSTNFAAVASSSKTRQVFVRTSIELMNDLGLDGLDIDWEYPKSHSEGHDYVKLLRELRHGLDHYAASKGDSQRYLLTAAMPCGESNYKQMDLGAMAHYLDYFYLMAYDLAGSWSDRAGHQANLFGGEQSVHQAVQHYIRSGVPSRKLVMGMPIYGRAFQNTQGIGHPYQGVGQGSWEQGVYDYKQLPLPGAVEYYDQAAGASYSYDGTKGELITYDSPMVLETKSQYIVDHKLGGAMFWESSADHPTGHHRSILDTIHNAFVRRGQRLDQSLNHVHYPTSVYENVRQGL